MLIDILVLLNVVVAGVVTGSAWAYTLEIHPALTIAKPGSSLDVFTPMFEHANRLQPVLGGVIAALSLIISFMTGNWLWFVAAIIMQIVGPYTIFILMPVNRRLMANDADPTDPALIADLKGWGKLHFVRTALNTLAFVIFCYLLMVYVPS